MSSSSSASKRVSSKKASRGTAIIPSSPFRVVTSSGVTTSPGPNTIIESWQYAKQKKDNDAAWHSSVRQKIIELVATQPSQLSADELNLLTSQKLAAVAVNLITVESPNGPDPALPIDALLAELDQSAEKPYVKTAIRSALAKRHTQVDAASLLAALQADEAMHHSSTAMGIQLVCLSNRPRQLFFCPTTTPGHHQFHAKLAHSPTGDTLL